MLLEIKTIPLLEISSALPLETPDPKDVMVTENDPAVRVMTDFTKIKPVTIEAYMSLDLALHKMRTMGVRLLLVTDKNDDIDGVITSYDVQSEKPVKYAEDNDLCHTEINVGMIMTRLADTPVFDYTYVKQSLIRHVINTMKELDRPHTLVVETIDNGQQKIRGIFSTSQISKALGKTVYEPLHTSHSLAEMQQTTGH